MTSTAQTPEPNTDAKKILVLNGPNLNMVGTREPEIYGSESLSDIMDGLTEFGATINCEVTHRQSNIEGELINALHDAMTWADGVVFNAGGFTHTSVALRDAISACQLPVIETHLSNVHAREEFRHHSMLAAVCVGVVAGFGSDSYRIALTGLRSYIDRSA